MDRSEWIWIPTFSGLPPDGKLVETMILDIDGPRRKCTLMCIDGQWFYPDGSGYSIDPSHWTY